VLGGDRKNGPKRRKTRRLGHRYVFFPFLRVLLTFFVYLGSIHVVNERGGLCWAAIGKTGPNDARRVVWAIGMSFFIYFAFYLF
jgi:hypothetical protein